MPNISRLSIAAALLAAAPFTGSVAMAACASPVKPDATDPALRQFVAGTWFSVNEQMGMRQQMYQTFLPTGVFEYHDQTCSLGMPGAPCSKNYGHGFWMATKQADGSIYIRIQVSDLTRQNDCTGWPASFPDRDSMVIAGGGAARRVQ